MLTAALAMLLAGCATDIRQGSLEPVQSAGVRVFLPPFANATDDDHASRALTEITASVLVRRGVVLAQSEAALVRSRADDAGGKEGLFLEAARAVNATHLLIGTVHEYRYKTDLDGDPAVGLSLRLVDATDGRTLWQGSSGRVSVWFASLTKTAQRAVDDLVRTMPIVPPSQAKR
jgi:hypothetical protein